MQVFDEITKSWKNSRSCFKIVLQHLPNQIIFGYVSDDKDNVRILLKNSSGVMDYYITNLNLFKGDILYSNRKGVYFSPIGFTDSDILLEQLIKGSGSFPYLLTREYEAIESFDIFKDRQTLLTEETLIHSQIILSIHLDWNLKLLKAIFQKIYVIEMD